MTILKFLNILDAMEKELQDKLGEPIMPLKTLVVMALIGTALQTIDVFFPALMKYAIFIAVVGGTGLCCYYIYKAKILGFDTYKYAYRKKFQYEYLRDSIEKIQDRKNNGMFITHTLINQMDLKAIDKIDPFCKNQSWK